MLYIKALREGLAELPQANAELRAEIDREAAQRGWPALHAELALVDPATAERLQPTDAQRIQRAIEVVRLSGRPLGSFYAEQEAQPLPYDCLAMSLQLADRKVLHERIAQRFDAMLAGGLVDEVIALREKYTLSADMPSMRCVGYRQVWEMLEGRLPLAELRDRGVFSTRQFAKRQLTWLRSMPDFTAENCLAPNLISDTLTNIDRFLAR